MGFEGVPSADKTVTLSRDLVCAGTWAFEWASSPAKAYRTTFDLNGHSLTFLKAYSSPEHGYIENVLVNGTIAFTNEAGQVNEVKFWNDGRPGYRMTLGEGANFIGTVIFQDAPTKSLTLEGGAVMTGNYNGRGNDCRLVVRGEGTTLCALDSDPSLGNFALGGSGTNSAAYVLDGAAVTNVHHLLVGATRNHKTGDYSYLCVSNATLEMDFRKDGNYDVCLLGGWGSSFCRMDVLDGASVTWGIIPSGNNRRTAIGNEGGRSNLLHIAGAGTHFTNDVANSDVPLTVGYNSCDNTLRVTDGAVASFTHLSAGGHPRRSFTPSVNDVCVTSCCNRIVVDRGGALEAETLDLSYSHTDFNDLATFQKSLIASNVLEVADGGSVKVGMLYCGLLAPSFDNAVIVRDEGSRLEVTNGYLYVGRNGSCGNRFEVLDGGQFVWDKSKAQWHIGTRVSLAETSARPSNGNRIRLDGVSLDHDSDSTVYIGDTGMTNNTFWVGTGSDIRVKNFYLRGYENAVIVSNGVLRAFGRFYINCNASGEHAEGVGGRNRLSFYGPNAQLVCGGSSGVGAFHDETTLDFHVPAGGFVQAPLSTTAKDIQLADDLTVAFDFSALKGSGERMTTELMRTMGKADAIVMSDEPLEKIRRAAAEEAARCRLRAWVTLSSDKKALSLRIAPHCGAAIIVR